MAKVDANLDAIRTLKAIEAADRSATPQEQEILSKYTGWGGLKPMFDVGKESYRQKPPTNELQRKEYENWEKKWGKRYDELRQTLTPEEWEAAWHSIQNAHYTSRTVINAMWDAVERLGFRGGYALEPAAGIGHFMGLAPEGIRNSVLWRAVELDDVTARIARQLYPSTRIDQSPFEKTRIAINSQDLVITNVPFLSIQDTGKLDSRYPVMGLHNYFLVRGMDLVKPGGLMAAITSTSTMDNQSSREARQLLEDKADLVGAIRLPNDAFFENAGTKVTTDILFFRKRDQHAFRNQPFRDVVQTQGYQGQEVAINEYFAKNPDMMLGEMSTEGEMRGRAGEQTLIPKPGADLGKELDTAIEKLPKDIAQQAPPPRAPTEPDWGQILLGVDAAPPDLLQAKPDNLVLDKEGNVRILSEKGQFEVPEWANDAKKVERAKAYIPVRNVTRDLVDIQGDPNATDEQVAKVRKMLNERYDAFVKKHGYFNQRGNTWLEDDVDFPLVLSLEDVETQIVEGFIRGKKVLRKNNVYSKGAMFTQRTIFPVEPPARSDNLPDALEVSLSWKAQVDPEYLAQLTNMPVDEVGPQLEESGLAFQNPETGLWEIHCEPAPKR